ncbi:hypothetical protein PR002_g25095 [Phytophthora rubi]|uniref:Secreted protein n=1 Tax=Phytophthora rubi TaxID=129364 RepID=A0A6A3I2X2_9STRA|nr:hypothetical protein PR002_g25095 [Phytophthora rubi]
MAVLPVPVLVASLMCGSRCQLLAWSVAAGASGRLGLLLPEPVAGLVPVLPEPFADLVCCCQSQLPA